MLGRPRGRTQCLPNLELLTAALASTSSLTYTNIYSFSFTVGSCNCSVASMSLRGVPPFSTPSCYSSSNSYRPKQPRPSEFASFASLLPSTGGFLESFGSDLNSSHLDDMTTPIPLHCNICPKQPDFSDVSHLLTHIASKGHLSHYYKVKVRSSTEVQAAEQIDAYDRWYAEWNVEELMSDRMNMKDKKRPRTRLPGRLNQLAHLLRTGLRD